MQNRYRRYHMLHLLSSKIGIVFFSVGALLLASCASPGYTPGNLARELPTKEELIDELGISAQLMDIEKIRRILGTCHRSNTRPCRGSRLWHFY
jgi:hypothetical protein